MNRAARAPLLVALGALVVAAVTAPATGTFGAFTAKVTNSADSVTTKSRFVCADTAAGDSRRGSAYFEWALTEASGATAAADSSIAGRPGTYNGTAQTKDTASPLACPNDSGGGYVLNGTNDYVTTTSATASAAITTNFSMEVWFKTTVKQGKLMGFESAQTGTGGSYDKHLYIGTNGLLYYGIYPGAVKTLVSTAVVTDGKWHQVVATTSSTAGSVLYLDGASVASDTSMTTAQSFTGWWRVGYGALSNWTNASSTLWFNGSMRFAAAYAFVLSSSEVAADWSVGAPS